MPQNKAGVGTCNIPERNRRRHGVWFWLRCDFCSFVGFGNAFRTVKKRAPKVRSFSGPKNERTRWAPIMGARFVASKTGPKYGPISGTTSQLNPQPSTELVLGSCPPVFPEGLPASQPDPIANQNSISTNDKVVRFTATEPGDMTHTVPAR
jgi:hypothetical protein